MGKIGIERTKIDLSYLDPGEQFEFFCDELSRRIVHHDSTIIGDRKDFPAEVDVLEVGKSLCITVSSPIHVLERTADHVARSDFRGVFLVVPVSGTMEARCEDRVSHVGPGGILFLDHAKPFSFKSSSDSGFHSSFAVRLNEEDYLEPAEKEALACEKRFSRHRLARLLKTSLAQLSINMKAGVDDIETATLLGVVETLVSLIVHDRSVETMDPAGENAARLVEVEIARQLVDERLSPDSVAHHLGFPADRVEQIMMGRSTSFVDFVREERLSMAMSRLCDETHSGKTIEQIAQSCGFSELTNFYYAFKDAFQCTPAEIRRVSERPRQLN